MIQLIIKKNDSAQTLLNFLKKRFKDEPLSKIYYLFYQKKIRVNNKRVTNFKYRLQENDVIIIYDNKINQSKPNTKITTPQPDIKVAYQDDNILVVIKDHNILVHSINDLSLDNMVRYYLQTKQPAILQEQTFVISHQYRLDKLTKGLVIYPKTKVAQQILTKAQDENHIIKKYYAIVTGQLPETINGRGYIYHDEEQQRMIFSEEPSDQHEKTCETIIKPIFHDNGYSLVECQLVTGRKHQIRATLAYYQLHIVGDYKYGSEIRIKDKIMLFAYYLSFKNLPEPLSYLNNQEIMINNLKSDLILLIKKG